MVRITSALQRLRRDQRGQAMVEYASFLWMGLIYGGICWTFLGPQLMNAIDKYLKGIYYILNLPLP